ncbi:MAG: amidohydrolase family protein, partial [Firmicutes bacterium]|nr:amidohydrolase family protein [Bacillota bacterium]
MKTLIKNGRIIDPSQKLDAFANLLAEDGKIVGLTEEEPEADLVVDAKGHMVTPGFIDIHMHEDSFGDDGILLQNTF